MENSIKKALSKLLKEDVNLETPPNKELGDYAFPCFSLVKKLKKSPDKIAQEIAANLFIKGVEIKVAGPYINFFINKMQLVETTLKNIFKQKEKYGSLRAKGRAQIEHTSINPNASPHVGRARNAILGDSIARILRFHGYKTTVRFFVNDSGKQIGVLVLGAGNKVPSFNQLLKLYQESYKKLENNLELEQEVFLLLKKLEAGDKKVKQRFRKIVDVCIKGQTKILSDLGITYDKFDYESDYIWNNRTAEILNKLKNHGKVFTDEEGREVLDLSDYDVPVEPKLFVLTRSDGTSLYGLRDIVYNVDKIKWASSGKNVIVLGEDQKAYQKQIAAALDILGFKAPEVVHYSFVLLKSGKMSTRRGNLVLLEDLMRESREKAGKEIKKRTKVSNSKLAKSIGYGAVKYSILKVSPDKNVVFDWESALSFDGDSSPYLQYSHARACSILKKAKLKIASDIDYSLLKEKEELELILMLNDFNKVALDALDKLRPSLVAKYSYELAKKFNEFYHKCQCITKDKKLTQARLLLVDCLRQVLANCLGLLGIDAIEKM